VSAAARRLFVDTAVIVYATGGPHPERAACRRIIEAAEAGDIELHASVELVQEAVFHRTRRSGAVEAAALGRALLDLLVLHPVDATVMAGAIALLESGTLRGRDGLHAATALTRGFAAIVTTDRDFAEVPGLGMLTPAEALGPAGEAPKSPAPE
jgi:predicted nucleic acid-binding protein